MIFFNHRVKGIFLDTPHGFLYPPGQSVLWLKKAREPKTSAEHQALSIEHGTWELNPEPWNVVSYYPIEDK
jgi:hypothetical protein